MNKRLLAITSLLLVTLSLSAIDLDEATAIIEEASKATEGLQNKFDILSEDNATTEKTVVPVEEITKVETTATVVNPVEVIPQEVIEVTEVNKTVKETVVVTEVNETIKDIPAPIQVAETLPTIEEIVEKPIEVLTKDDNSTTITKPEPIVVETTIVTEEIMAPIVPSEINVSQEITEVVKIVETEKTTENNVTEEEPEEVEGSVMKGLVIFKTRLKGPCGMTGEEFAKNYSQEDWDDIYDTKEFEKVVIEICPKMEGRYQDRWTADLYQFSLKYASDSDEIPEC